MTPKTSAIYSGELTAEAKNVASGVTYIGKDTNDEVGTGTLSISGNAAPGDVAYGKSFYGSNLYEKQTGTLLFDGTAVEGDVIYGKTFYNENPSQKKTGRLLLYATASNYQVVSGKTFYGSSVTSGSPTLETGILSLTGSAAATDVVAGKTFYNTNPYGAQGGTIATAAPNGNAGDYLSASTITVPARRIISVFFHLLSSADNIDPQITLTYNGGGVNMSTYRRKSRRASIYLLSNTTDVPQAATYTTTNVTTTRIYVANFS